MNNTKINKTTSVPLENDSLFADYAFFFAILCLVAATVSFFITSGLAATITVITFLSLATISTIFLGYKFYERNTKHNHDIKNEEFQNKYEVLSLKEVELVKKIRKEADKDRIEVFECSEKLRKEVESWWKQNKNYRDDLKTWLKQWKDSRVSEQTPAKDRFETLKGKLIEILKENIKEQTSADGKELYDDIKKLRRKEDHLVGLCIKGLFKAEDPILSYMVHEAMCSIFHLRDIKYQYEDHKELYIKPEGLKAKEWGNGQGEIKPHCDDLYEKIETDLLALTVGRDETKTPTTFIQTKHILDLLTDQEVLQLSKIKAKFISGKNVGGGKIVKEEYRNILELTKNGVSLVMDFRVDDVTGQRMQSFNDKDQALLDKIREFINNKDNECIQAIDIIPGGIGVINNKAALHSRADLKGLTEDHIKKIKDDNIETTPRYLNRSKGPVIDNHLKKYIDRIERNEISLGGSV